jgi:hypothetical protein
MTKHYLGDCAWCDEPVTKYQDHRLIPHVGESGAYELPWHEECLVRGMIGGLNHLQGKCICCGGTEPPDPPGMSRREAAIAAVTWFRDNHQTLPGARMQ